MGRAARHVNGKVIMYANKITKSMKAAISEVERRRKIQLKYNKDNNIIPKGISKPIRERLRMADEPETKVEQFDIKEYEFKTMNKKNQKKLIKELESEMKAAAELLEFETAAKLRDKIKELKRMQ